MLTMIFWLLIAGLGGMMLGWSGGKSRLGLALVIIAAVFILKPAFGHDHNKPGLDAWYSGLRSAKGPCCGGPSVDAKTLDGPEWGRIGNHYWVIVDGVRHVVPDDAILNQPNIDGRTLVWPIGGWGGVTIRCFLPGAGG